MLVKFVQGKDPLYQSCRITLERFGVLDGYTFHVDFNLISPQFQEFAPKTTNMNKMAPVKMGLMSKKTMEVWEVPTPVMYAVSNCA